MRCPRALRGMLTAGVAGLSLWTAGLGAQAPADEEAAILALTDSALAAVTRSDFIAFTDLMVDSAVTFSAGMRNGEYRMRVARRAEVRRRPSTGRYVELGFRPEIRVSVPLAMVWLPYDFYRDGTWSHCGVDLFTLLKVDGRWRIAAMAWSVEQPPACTAHPDGPPAGQ